MKINNNILVVVFVLLLYSIQASSGICLNQPYMVQIFTVHSQILRSHSVVNLGTTISATIHLLRPNLTSGIFVPLLLVIRCISAVSSGVRKEHVLKFFMTNKLNVYYRRTSLNGNAFGE